MFTVPSLGRSLLGVRERGRVCREDTARVRGRTDTLAVPSLARSRRENTKITQKKTVWQMHEGKEIQHNSVGKNRYYELRSLEGEERTLIYWQSLSVRLE